MSIDNESVDASDWLRTKPQGPTCIGQRSGLWEGAGVARRDQPARLPFSRCQISGDVTMKVGHRAGHLQVGMAVLTRLR